VRSPSHRRIPLFQETREKESKSRKGERMREGSGTLFRSREEGVRIVVAKRERKFECWK